MDTLHNNLKELMADADLLIDYFETLGVKKDLMRDDEARMKDLKTSLTNQKHLVPIKNVPFPDDLIRELNKLIEPASHIDQDHMYVLVYRKNLVARLQDLVEPECKKCEKNISMPPSDDRYVALLQQTLIMANQRLSEQLQLCELELEVVRARNINVLQGIGFLSMMCLSGLFITILNSGPQFVNEVSVLLGSAVSTLVFLGSARALYKKLAPLGLENKIDMMSSMQKMESLPAGLDTRSVMRFVTDVESSVSMDTSLAIISSQTKEQPSVRLSEGINPSIKELRSM